MCDLAPQPLCADTDAIVTINVIRNNHTPYFLPNPDYPYVSNRDSINPGETVITARADDDDDAVS